jgi:hypothetical protein
MSATVTYRAGLEEGRIVGAIVVRRWRGELWAAENAQCHQVLVLVLGYVQVEVLLTRLVLHTAIIIVPANFPFKTFFNIQICSHQFPYYIMKLKVRK